MHKSFSCTEGTSTGDKELAGNARPFITLLWFCAKLFLFLASLPRWLYLIFPPPDLDSEKELIAFNMT